MKKSIISLVLLLALFSLSFSLAATNSTNHTSHTSSENATVSNNNINESKIDKGFSCLEQKAGDCSGLTTQEIALTIMATPDNIFDNCVSELKKKEKANNWGNVRDTALAIIALNHAGKNTTASEKWLLNQAKTPTNLIWYLQQDSNGVVNCHIGYNTKDYSIHVDAGKKIDRDAGSCLSRSQSNFWLKINNNCYNEKFSIECDKNFISNLIYRNKISQTIYVLGGTASAPAFGSTELQVNSKCFGANGCNYEATAWAALALLKTGHNVDNFVPYIIAMSETNKRYLPSSFIYILTNYEDYANSLISEQQLGNYWEAPSSAYGKYYDTSLALLALSDSSAEQVAKAKKWLLFSQDADGCWNSVGDTAIALWALTQKSRKTGSSSTSNKSSVTYCSEANYFCIPSTECTDSKNVGNNYFCPSLSDTCCMTQNIKTCAEDGGQVCASGKVCTGNSKKASDTDSCCTGSCEDKVNVQITQCESNSYTCMNSCSQFQEPISNYSCSQEQVCCGPKTAQVSQSSSRWWVWVLTILIIITLGAIIYLYREQLKLYWFEFKTKFKKDDNKGAQPPSGSSYSGIPPRPGFPPIRRNPTIPSQPRPVRQVRNRPVLKTPYDRRDKAMSETFKKLRDISK